MPLAQAFWPIAAKQTSVPNTEQGMYLGQLAACLVCERSAYSGAIGFTLDYKLVTVLLIQIFK